MKFFCTIFLLFLGYHLILSQGQIALPLNEDQLNISHQVYYLKDKSSSLTLQDVQSDHFHDQWLRNTSQNLSFGNHKMTIWHQFKILNPPGNDAKWMLVVDNHLIDSITLFKKSKDGSYISERSGRLTPFTQRSIKYNTFAFDVSMPPGDSIQCYLKISSYTLNYPIYLVQYNRFVESQMHRGIIMGALIGFLLMIVMYNLFIYYFERDKNYLFYIVYVFLTIIKITDFKGYMDIVYVGPLAFMRAQTPGITPFLGLAMILFTVQILDLRKNLPGVMKWLVLIFLPMGLSALIFDIINLKLYSTIINQVGTITCTLFLYICAIIVYRKGYRPARFYIIAVSAFFLSICIYTLGLFGVIPINSVTDNLVEAGSGLEMLLFSLALGDKIRIYKQAKETAEKDLVRSLQANEELITNQNKMLETKVLERTQELFAEKEKSENLLLNILPYDIAEELKAQGFSNARQYENTSVLFTDFVNFTGISEQYTPTELVKEINTYFTEFDNIITQAGLEKIKTIGDSYLAVCGLPVLNEDHAMSTVTAAIRINEYMQSQVKNGSQFQIRIGIHSGPLVAGIIGVKKFAYDVWGDTVNTASRMEQNSEPGKINISQSTYELIKGKVICQYRGKLPAKNKGDIDMYFVEGLK